MILAIDPGTKAGWAIGEEHTAVYIYGAWNFTPKAKTKTRPAELKHSRLLKAYTALQDLIIKYRKPDVIVCEDAAGFTRGKTAVEASHKFRAVIELFCLDEDIPLTYVQPADIKRFITGKGNADKEAMIAAAQKKFGYTGNNDDEADAICLLNWGRNFT